jgi:hypothetical protein
MKSKLYSLLLLITSLFGYLEWSANQHIFLFQAEIEVFSKLFSNPLSILHPFTILPILGQMVLLIILFQEKPRKALVYFSISKLSILLVFMFIVGIMAMNFKIIISTIPFILLSLLTIRYYNEKTASLNS